MDRRSNCGNKTMRAREFIRETASAGATSSGSVAVVAQPMGAVITRTQNRKPGKYKNSLTRTK
jgi:hypothetical protein